ncbi:hypothetical protein WG947_02720 [Pontibacter sp. H259]|uniref:hypothetical protein n=1 Tax=Pontibacter sp. H259 TaxID=3133421 RepID=UPI0030BD947E
MYRFKALALVSGLFLLFPFTASSQVDLALKVRVTDYQGTFGETYNAIGYEPSLTIKPGDKLWAAGLSYSKNALTYDADSELKGRLNLVQFHGGVKTSVGSYVHPFAYALVGFRFMRFDNKAVASDEDPLFTSLSLGYGGRAGLQLGKGRWRFEGSIDYLTGTNARYVTPESFRKATETGKSYRDFADRSPISGVTVAAGITYAITRNDVTIE